MQVPRMIQTNVLGWVNDPEIICEKQLKTSETSKPNSL